MTFKSEIDADLGNMLSDDEFGYEVTYTPQVGAALTLNGIFDKDFISVDVGQEAPPITDQKPTLMVRLSDFATPPLQDDTCVVDGNTYTVLEVQPDGTGAALLILEAQ